MASIDSLALIGPFGLPDIIFLLLLGFPTAFIARSRGRSPAWWFILGVILPILSIAILLLLPGPEISHVQRKGSTSIFKRGLHVLLRNPILVAVPMVFSLALSLVSAFLLSDLFPEGQITRFSLVGVWLSGCLSAFLANVVEIITIVLARGLLEKGRSFMSNGFQLPVHAVKTYVTGAFVLAVATVTGFYLLIVPGLAISLFTLFMFPAMVIGGLRPITAAKVSFELVKSNFQKILLPVIILALIHFASYLLAQTAGMVTGDSELLVALLAGIFSGIGMTYTVIVIYLLYCSLTGNSAIPAGPRKPTYIM